MFNLYSFLTYIFVTSFTPGPNNITTMSNSAKYGFRRNLPFSFGIWAGFTLVLFLSGLFSAALYSIMPAIKPFMLVIGASYMLWLAWKVYKSGSEIEMKESKNLGFITGFLLQFINPKCIIYAITLMSSFILPYFNNIPSILGFSILASLVGYASITCWALFGAVFNRLFSKHSKIINTVMALLLCYCAAALFL